MKKLLFPSCALLALIAMGPVRAADMAVGTPAPAYVPVNDWTGFYLGGHAGYGWGHDPVNELLLGNNIGGLAGFTTNPAAPLTDINSKGVIGGGHFGYIQQWGNWVGGIEIDLSASDIKGSTAGANAQTTSTTLIPFPLVITSTTTITNAATRTDKFEMLGSARARLGVLAWPNMLFYGTAGLAWTRFRQSTSETITVANSTTTIAPTTTITNLAVSNVSSEFGWVAGVGGETKIYNTNWLFRVEYLHYDFGNQGGFSGTQVSNGGGAVLTNTNFRNSGNLTADVVRAGISYKFGGGPI